MSHISGRINKNREESVIRVISLSLTVWRLERDADFRGGVFLGLNVLLKNGILVKLR